MSTLTVNGLNLARIMLAVEDPQGDRRDVGEQRAAVDGSMQVTRQTRKRDLAFRTPALSSADAYAWESLLIGDGEVWSFDVSLYGSKGSPPVSSTGCTLGTTSPSPKFGAKRLKITAGNQFSVELPSNVYGYVSAAWTAMFWHCTDGSTWTHYVIRSDGAKWVGGVRNDGASTSAFFTYEAPNVNLTNDHVTDDRFFDDFVILPFLVLPSWPPVFAAATAAFPPLPYLDLAGDLVPEQATRRVLGQVTESIRKVPGGQRHMLSVKLLAK